MSKELSVDDELYTDIALQLFTAYASNDNEATHRLIEGYALSNDDDPTFMPGLIFASMMHMNVLLSSIAEATNISIQEALMYYAATYNLHIREEMAQIPALHQGYAKEMYTKYLESGE